MEKSVINRSQGVVERRLNRLSGPSASPTTTHVRLRSMSIRNPMRTTGWSSAIITRIVGFILFGDWNTRKITPSYSNHNDQSRPHNHLPQRIRDSVLSLIKQKEPPYVLKLRCSHQ